MYRYLLLSTAASMTTVIGQPIMILMFKSIRILLHEQISTAKFKIFVRRSCSVHSTLVHRLIRLPLAISCGETLLRSLELVVANK